MKMDEDIVDMFPVVQSAVNMSLRDYFAAHALQGLIPMYCQGQPEPTAPWLATVAYVYADAMLKAANGHGVSTQEPAAAPSVADTAPKS